MHRMFTLIAASPDPDAPRVTRTPNGNRVLGIESTRVDDFITDSWNVSYPIIVGTGWTPIDPQHN